MSSTLVIGDPHTCVEDDNKSRFDSLGNFIAAHQPENIVQLGDFMTYDSISSHNRSKRLTMEGRRLNEELRVGLECYNRLMTPIKNLNRSRAKNRKAQYKPNMFWIEGNHEDRALRYVEENPEMEGLVDYKTLFNPEDDGWVVVPYREHCLIRGVLYTHIPMNGNNQPIGSKHAVKNILNDYDCSVTFGHSHKLVYESAGIKTSSGNRRITSLAAGCFFSHEPDYCRGSAGVRDWWAGIVLQHHLNDQGDYDLETIALDRLLALY